MGDSRPLRHVQPFAFLMFFQVFGAGPIAGPDRGQGAQRLFGIEFSFKTLPGRPWKIHAISCG
jgi:hypothetical protein